MLRIPEGTLAYRIGGVEYEMTHYTFNVRLMKAWVTGYPVDGDGKAEKWSWVDFAAMIDEGRAVLLL